MTTLTLYGIKNCDTVRKARTWLTDHGVAHQFHDFRSQGLDRSRLSAWVQQLGWEALLNKRGQTWRKLPEAQRQGLDVAKAIQLMLDEPTLIKRPVLTDDTRLLVGFSEAEYQTLIDS